MSRVNVSAGDRFTRVGQRDKVYVVTDIRTKPGQPTHAKLKLESTGETMLIGVSALADKELYRRLIQ